MRKNGNVSFDDSFSNQYWNGEYIGNLSTTHLKRVYKYCLLYGEVNKAIEIKKELEMRGVFDVRR